jgi:hypothetical protein
MNPTISDKIDDYLKGKLEGDALAAFEKNLANDTDLARQVELFQLEKRGVDVLVEKDLRQKMQAWQAQVRPKNEENMPENAKNTEGGKRLLFLLGIGVFMALLTLVLYLNSKNNRLEIPKTQEQKLDDLPVENQDKSIEDPLEKQGELPRKSLENTLKKPQPIAENAPRNKDSKAPNNDKNNGDKTDEQGIKKSNIEDLALNLYDKPDFSKEVLKNPNTESEVLLPLFQAWQRQDFNQVIALGLKSQNDPNRSIQIKEILGHAYFKTRQYEEAEKVFSMLTKKDTGETGEKAAWYRVLCLVAAKKTSEAKIGLADILKEKNHLKRDNALELERSLTQF